MGFWRNVFSLLSILLALSAARAYAGNGCEDELSRVSLQTRLVEVAQPDAELGDREALLAQYDRAIQRISDQLEDLKAQYSENFNWHRRLNAFDGERVAALHVIREMDLDLRELQSERRQLAKLLPKKIPAKKTVSKPAPSISQPEIENNPPPEQDWFLSPLNPAGPNYGLIPSLDGDSD